MITDLLENIALYKNLNHNILKGLDFIKATDFSKLADGKIEIEGDAIFASVNRYKTKPYLETQWESHFKYIDIQYITQGSEKIFYGPVSQMKEEIAYNSENDIQFLSGKGDYVTLEPGRFVILFPSDAHMPCIQIGDAVEVRKVVVKVRI
jgi:biofilm protein TabA